MAQFVPDPDYFDPQELVEQLGAELANRYAGAEDELIREIAKRAYRDIELQAAIPTATPERGDYLRDWREKNRRLAELAGHRAQAIRELQFIAAGVVDRLRSEKLAEQLVEIAAREGEAAAAAQLGMARRLPATTTLTGSATQAVSSLVISLESRLEALNFRITRYPQDAYQRVISMTAPNQLLGIQTSQVAQRQAVQRFLSEGITGFVDRADRRWRIGTYSEMAGRTAVNRAFNDATTWRLGQAGVHLATIQGGFDACENCAAWIGKVVSLDGSPAGARIMPSAVADKPVTVMVAGTVEQARNAGWNHPNCRDRLVAYLPGTAVKQQDFKYNADAERARERQREIEREIRSAKRDAAVAGDDVSRKAAEREVSQLQGEMREYLQQTGRTRQNYREQLHFSDGR